jgi:putative FmdB family regulatory protein
MPIYEFHCPSCDHEFEELGRVGGVAPCPECDEEKPNRRISNFAPPRKLPLPSVTALDGVGAQPAPVSGLAPTATFVGCEAVDCGTGLALGPGTHAVSQDFRFRGNDVAVDNDGGVFEDTGTIYE